MNVFKTLTLAATGLAIAHSASAVPLVINIVGSNGDRATTNTAIPKLLTGTLTWAGAKSDPTQANYGVWTGGSFNGVPVTIRVNYIGATGGIAAVAGSLPVAYLPTTASGTALPDPAVSGNPNDPAVPDFTLSTNFQSTSPFQGTYLGHFYEDLDDNLVGVIGLKWLGSKNYPGNNLTTNQAQYLFSSGRVPLALFTGLHADETKLVFATGRNTDAGQRYVAHTEIGLGINATVKQYKPAISGAAAGVGGYTVGGTVTAHALWPVETFSGVSSQTAGNSGFTTGANLAPALTAVLGSNAYTLAGTKPTITAGYYISYLTETDATNIAIPNGAVELKWNGITFSHTAIAEGQYTFWTYEHTLKRSSLAGTQLDFFDALTAQIHDVDAVVAGLKIDDVFVNRAGEGGIVSANYF